MRIEINRPLHKKILELIESAEIENNKISQYNAQSLRDDILDQICIHLNESYEYIEDVAVNNCHVQTYREGGKKPLKQIGII